MMIRFASVVLLAAVGTASADTLENVEKTLTEKFQKYTSLSADVTMTMQMAPGMKANSTGTMEFLRHDGKEKSRIDLTMKMDQAGHSFETKMTHLHDGTNAYAITEMMGQKRVMRTRPSQMPGRAGGEGFFDDLKRDNDLKLLPDAKVDGAAAYVIEATPKDGRAQGPGRMQFYFDKARGLMLKTVGLNPAGDSVMVLTLSKIKVNPKLDPERFVFKHEPGVDVIDMTGR